MSRVMRNLGLEAIEFQNGASNLYKRLTKEVGIIRAGGTITSKAIRRSALDKITFEETGIKVQWDLDETEEPNACMLIPDININHPLLDSFTRRFMGGEQLTKKAMSSGKSKFKAWVDLKTGRVGGLYSEIELKALVTKGLMDQVAIPDDAIAGIILHEIGHAFTFYEYMVSITTLNYAVSDALLKLQKTHDTKKRVEILTQYEKATGTKLDDKETIVKHQDGETIYAMVMGSTVREARNAVGMPYYTATGCEFVADQFAARHGGALGAAKGLDIIYRMYGVPIYNGWVGAAIASLFGFFAFLFFAMNAPMMVFLKCGWTILAALKTSALLGFVAALFVLLINPMGEIYDDPKDRVRRLLRECQAALKNPKLKGDVRRYYLYQIDGLRNIDESYTRAYAWNEAIWAFIIPTGKRIGREEKFNQAIEQMVNNNLYEMSARYKQLGA